MRCPVSSGNRGVLALGSAPTSLCLEHPKADKITILAGNRDSISFPIRQNGYGLKVKGVHFHDYDDVNRSNFQYVVVGVDPNTTKIIRDQLMHSLHAKDIIVHAIFTPANTSWNPTPINTQDLYTISQTPMHFTKSNAPSDTRINDEEVQSLCSAIIHKLTSN